MSQQARFRYGMRDYGYTPKREKTMSDREKIKRLERENAEMVALIRRVAFEPVGPSDASHETVLEMLTAEARALLAKIEGK
jgi:hypothetical protein